MNTTQDQELASAYLQLFLPKQQQRIINAIRNYPALTFNIATVNADKSQNPLPIMGFLPENATAAEIRAIIAAFSLMASHSISGAAKINTTSVDYWKELLMTVCHISDALASSLAAKIATVDSFSEMYASDSQNGKQVTYTEQISQYLKKIRHPFTDSDSLPTEHNYDMINEMKSCGDVLFDLASRARLGFGTANDVLGDPFLLNVAQSIAAGDIEEGGLDDEQGSLIHKSIGIATQHMPYGDIEAELGGLPLFAAKQAMKLRKRLIQNTAPQADGSESNLLRSKIINGVAKVSNRAAKRKANKLQNSGSENSSASYAEQFIANAQNRKPNAKAPVPNNEAEGTEEEPLDMTEDSFFEEEED